MFKQIREQYKRIIPPVWRKKVQIMLAILIAGVVIAIQFWGAESPALMVHFYDVGQGDAIHIRTQDGFDVLIDGGPDASIVEKLGRNMPFWDKTVELMILTHPHADHLVGQLSVLDRFDVKRVLSTGVLHTTDEYLMWLEKIKEKGIAMETVKAGMEYRLKAGSAIPCRQLAQKTQSFRPASETPLGAQPRSSDIPPEAGVGDHARSASATLLAQSTDTEWPDECPSTAGEEGEGGRLEILWPVEDLNGKRVVEKGIGEGGGLNDTSIVARFVFGQHAFLFTGDIGDEVEEQLLHKYNANMRISCQSTNTNSQFVDLDKICRFALQSDVLKVAHHGSKYSSSQEFLQAVDPQYAVIQVGKKNDFGHPHFQTLWRLKQKGAEILRNDKDGDVTFKSDGAQLRKMGE